MTELMILGLVDMHLKLGTEDNTEHANTEKKIRLKPEFTECLRTDEFEQLRGGFVPASDDEDEDEEEQG